MGQRLLLHQPGLSQTGPPPNSENQTFGFRYKGHGDPGGLILGYQGDQYIDLYCGSEWDKLVDDNGGKPSKTGWFQETKPLNVSAFPGADPTGIADSTSAVQAAYDALSLTLGGQLFFPPGEWKYNLLILKSNITVLGISHYIDGYAGTANLRNRHIPADITKPVIQVGNDTVYARGVHIRDCTFYGGNTGSTGVYFAGGAFENKMENCTVSFFTTCIKVKGGTSLPASIIYFNNVHGQPANVAGARGWLIANPANYPVSWTTEIDLHGCHWNGPSSGSGNFLFEIDSCEVKWDHCYMDVSPNRGVIFSHNVATPLPKLNAVNCNIDGALPTNVVFQGYTNDRIFTGLKSFNCQITGSWKDLDGEIIPPLPQQIDTILGKSSATRGTHILLGEDAGSFSNSKIQFRDQVYNHNPDIFVQGPSINIRADSGGSLRLADILGNTWAEVNANGAFFYGTGVNATTVPYLDSFKRIQSSAVTPTELGYLSGVTSAIQTRRRIVVQAADQSVTSSTTLVDATDLTVAVEANKTYTWEANLQFNDAGGVPGVQAAVTGPTSPTKVVINVLVDNTATGSAAFASKSSFGSIVTASGLTTGLSFVKVWGTIINGANAGNIAIQFAQNASDAAAVTLKAGSSLTVERIN